MSTSFQIEVAYATPELQKIVVVSVEENTSVFDGARTSGIEKFFPEIDYDKVDTIRGMDVIITTSAGNDEISYEMLKAMGLPIKEKSVQTEEVPVEEDNLNEEKNGEEV